MHWDLGLECQHGLEANTFWNKVREAIEKTPVSVDKPELLLVFGDAMLNPKFWEVFELGAGEYGAYISV